MGKISRKARRAKNTIARPRSSARRQVAAAVKRLDDVSAPYNAKMPMGGVHGIARVIRDRVTYDMLHQRIANNATLVDALYWVTHTLIKKAMGLRKKAKAKGDTEPTRLLVSLTHSVRVAFHVSDTERTLIVRPRRPDIADSQQVEYAVEGFSDKSVAEFVGLAIDCLIEEAEREGADEMGKCCGNCAHFRRPMHHGVPYSYCAQSGYRVSAGSCCLGHEPKPMPSAGRLVGNEDDREAAKALLDEIVPAEEAATDTTEQKIATQDNAAAE